MMQRRAVGRSLAIAALGLALLAAGWPVAGLGAELTADEVRARITTADGRPDLVDLDLTGLNLAGVDFRGADLRGSEAQAGRLGGRRSDREPISIW